VAVAVDDEEPNVTDSGPGADQPSLVIVSGKGGVGKSAVAAARATMAARMGRRVLALSATTSPGLGHHLARPDLHFDPVEIEPGLFAATIDLGEALQEYLQLQLKVPTPRFGVVARAFQVLATTAPGIREIITIGKAIHEAARGPWDVVVVDAPPTGQIGSFLRAPRAVSELVPTGRVRQQSTWMESILFGQDTEIVLVTLLEELPITETLEALAELTGLELARPPLVVANRVLSPLPVEDRLIDRLPDGPHREAARLHSAIHRSQLGWAEEIDVNRSLPYLFGVLTPPEVTARLAEELA
jgi:anion-transporting  ArsA/GET3 family ATPase